MKISFILIVAIIFSISICGQTSRDDWRFFEGKKYNVVFSLNDTMIIGSLVTFFDVGIEKIEGFFGNSFKEKFGTIIHPSRESLDKQWENDWGMEGFKSECWMVGSGVADQFDLLSPSVWEDEACEHNPQDQDEIQQIITHELMHVYHGQQNADSYFDGMQEMGWFIEGAAVFIAEQLNEDKIQEVKTLISEDRAPRTLHSAFEGKFRYAVCGSMVLYIHKQQGAEFLFSLLKAGTNKEVLTALNTTETKFLNDWKNFIEEF